MVYLDYAATSPVRPEVVTKIQQVLQENYGNPSSTYRLGKNAKMELMQARQDFANILGVDSHSLYFTSGATESNNWALRSQAHQARKLGLGNHIVASAIEHPSVKNVLKHLESQGFEVSYINPDASGQFKLTDFQAASKANTIGWTAMAVNNEVGAILPIRELGQAAKELGYWFHVDTVQAIGHLDWSFADLPCTSFVGSGHKFQAPKGIGFLVYQPFQKEMVLEPLLYGGGQEASKRSGTENIPYIAGMSHALTLMQADLDQVLKQHQDLSRYLFDQMDQTGIDYESNGDSDHQAAHIHNLWLKGIPASQVLIQMDLAGIYLSAGSACSAGSIQPSAVLQAYYPGQEDRWQESIRISFGRETSRADIDQFIKVLSELVHRKRQK
ncbi:cysteine desulfurase family protein [Eremococcus coleocola]|uniref:Aminotransferase, class V n=1 Tax=Eremococcus coleocola ACS-139-V-Col8 TaxID=908337 RepID=E4KP23_9LACT|nr:cysteine desulfurase family protein [Eremococcus coleocola]EFR31219.1 aminotransferase, class V [Eremococcus coleocola ACS-139-V-Col8]